MELISVSFLGAVRPLGPLRQRGARLAVAVHGLLGLALAETTLVDDALSDRVLQAIVERMDFLPPSMVRERCCLARADIWSQN